jgi:HprK-related kinase A
MLHAAVIECGGKAAILPAPPGSGKSTLCAALIHRGWRLLSDELTLISLADGRVWPLCRPVSLKNQSIDILRAYAPAALFSEVTHDTSKGTVAHMAVAREQLARMAEAVPAGWVVFPRYVAGAAARLTPRSRGDSMLELGRNAFNYALLGRAGFDALGAVVGQCDCFDFEYSALDDAVATFTALAQGSAP